MTIKPFCFVLMPFGQKPTSAGKIIDFDAVYRDLIAPAIRAADLEPLRADEEMAGGIIHKPMYERLILCEYAIADLTTANANVFYELGLRHAVRPASTVLIFAKDTGQLPFDVGLLRGIPYEVSADGKPDNCMSVVLSLSKRLIEARKFTTDSPVYQLVDGFPEIQHLKTDVFRDRVQYAEEIKSRLAAARKTGVEGVLAVELLLETNSTIDDTEAGVVIDLFLSYRAVKAWQNMINLIAKMSPPLANTVMVQEQLALALNRVGRGNEAETVLLNLIDKRGPSSETYGILGRVYKDRWDTANKDGKTLLAKGLLTKAIDAYLKGFEADWRDAYPGINAVTLMEMADPPDVRQGRILPVVTYAVERRIASGKPNYWDYATLLELAVLAKDEDTASTALANALASIRESWEPETTLRNVRLISHARAKRGEILAWTHDIEAALDQ
ncbi:TRAFs-binding domain-containing protein [Methylomonas sp. HW2-6]|uniref:TRAFs-binding domain-containing protein n=1 Tax=Methylomonas sp. HW2-6 TaxID=3376687 RepID=UPI004041CDCD